jgi:nitroimidazol reductase NimA-like FMN-containing flavoprotein (pyridoxamine 5'-phosphate oxidase superfamily)
MAYHMLRKEKEIVDANVLKKILKSAKYVTLALSLNDQPYLATLSHGYDEKHNCIYFHCAKEGKKLDYIKANNTIWGQAMLDYGYVENKCNHHWTSVQFHGRVTLLEELEDKHRAAECMIRQLEKNPEPLLAKLKSERLKETVFGRIDIAYMSGKKSENTVI